MQENLEEISSKLQNLAWKSPHFPPHFQELFKSCSQAPEAERRQLLEAVCNNVGNDPLKAWVRCIKWAKGLPHADAKSDLLTLLECCTQRFVDDSRYREDLRLLRIWIRYADCCPDPVQVFQFLEKKKIGQTHSLYYEAYAVILELRGDLVKADEVYQLGLSRQAQPLDQLQSMYKSFLKRKLKSRKEDQRSSQSSKAQPSDDTFQQELPKADATQSFRIGDETIAIKRYAEEAIVMGVDPQAAEVSLETHSGLVDPTINTKEAMVNVLSLFSQPLPMEQSRKSSRVGDAPGKSSAAGNMDLGVFVDEAFTNQEIHSNIPASKILPEETSFEVFVDESFAEDKAPEVAPKLVDPWDEELLASLLKGLKPPLSAYKGFYSSHKKFNGSISLSSLKSNARNKTLELGNSSYCIKGCTGQGAFAQVYLAHDEHDGKVVLKIQKPPCSWEFYIYRQLDERIPEEERKSFGCAWKMHVYSDCSIMVADYGQHGTLQDVINSYLAHGQKMDELLCMYYTIEMLRMLEVLHAAGIIHGDFKPDNLLIRSDSENWKDWSPDRPGGWRDQGLCLIDWGRSIDKSLFPQGTEFIGDNRTSSFRCIEMVEGRPWSYQVDTYGLCGIVHCMLHGSYMEIEEERCLGGRVYKPKAPLKRYWNTGVWDKVFKTLLNAGSGDPPLGHLRGMVESCVSSPQQSSRLKELLMKQTVMMYAPRR